jgi:hypothetical protein
MARQTVERFPPNRVFTADVGAISRRRHLIAALFEVDVTVAGERLRAHREQTGEHLSFTAWLITVLAGTLARFPTVHAYRLGPLWRSIPDGVDVSTLVEREVDGQRIPVPTVVRDADRLDVAGVSRALDAARRGPVSAGGSWLGGPTVLRVGAWAMALCPGVARRWLWRLALSFPGLARGVMGSVVVTSVGMMGQVRGWFVPTSFHPLALGVGSVVRKPMVLADDRIAARDVLHLTLLMDHDVVDGADMARFVAAFVEALEAAQGLEDRPLGPPPSLEPTPSDGRPATSA